jgi:hypothetical protein
VTTSRPWLGITTPSWLKESDTPQASPVRPDIRSNAAPAVVQLLSQTTFEQPGHFAARG